jgi:hypothetical protein
MIKIMGIVETFMALYFRIDAGDEAIVAVVQVVAARLE